MVAISHSGLIKPSYQQGFARGPSQSDRQEFWPGLIAGYHMALGPSGFLPDFSGHRGPGTFVNTPLWKLEPEWGTYCLEFAASDNDAVNLGSIDIPPRGSVVFEVLFTDNSARQRIWGGATEFEAILFTDESMSNDCWVAAANNELTNANYITFGRTYHLVFTWDNVTSGTPMQMFDAGKIITDLGNEGVADTDPGTVTVHLGRRTGNTTQDFNGRMRQWLLYDRVLPGNLIYEMASDPLGIVRPRRRVWAIAPAAGGGSLPPVGTLQLMGHGR